MSTDPTVRFTSRVEDYVRYRPGYPDEVYALLTEECGLGPEAKVADVGAGTGISTASLLSTGATVYAVEPNAAMRAAAEAALENEARFHSVEGTATATELPDASVDLVTAFQAFHWFDRDACRREFARILRPGGFVALVWNVRDESGTPFLQGYERLLRECAGDYLAVRHNAISTEDLEAWFGGGMRTRRFANAQRFDYDGALGRLMSSSYAPQADDPRHEPMVAAPTTTPRCELRRRRGGISLRDGGVLRHPGPPSIFRGLLEARERLRQGPKGPRRLRETPDVGCRKRPPVPERRRSGATVRQGTPLLCSPIRSTTFSQVGP